MARRLATNVGGMEPDAEVHGPTPMIRPPEPLDEDFPLGDGVADTRATASCPYCGVEVDLAVDPGGGAYQEYVEDCPVCCRPWTVTLEYDAGGRAEIILQGEDEG